MDFEQIWRFPGLTSEYLPPGAKYSHVTPLLCYNQAVYVSVTYTIDRQWMPCGFGRMRNVPSSCPSSSAVASGRSTRRNHKRSSLCGMYSFVIACSGCSNSLSRVSSVSPYPSNWLQNHNPSLTSLFSTNTAISQTKGHGWAAIPTQWTKASDILISTLAALLFSSHPKRKKDREAHLNYHTYIHTYKFI